MVQHKYTIAECFYFRSGCSMPLVLYVIMQTTINGHSVYWYWAPEYVCDNPKGSDFGIVVCCCAY